MNNISVNAMTLFSLSFWILAWIFMTPSTQMRKKHKAQNSVLKQKVDLSILRIVKVKRNLIPKNKSNLKYIHDKLDHNMELFIDWKINWKTSIKK